MVGLGSDHGGYDLKQVVIAYLKEQGIDYKDFGCMDKNSCDYPIYGGRHLRERDRNLYDRHRYFHGSQ